ncbi:C6 zinc cluster transcription factor-like protein [Saxophila tyrrhenica]|uniref:C6 zinc cluster transcription factor-like protein n=1 Tax=Saxophila tyrrhenica TaxID=1690608 RepID=A0AAV9P5V5_9PEZI|nr:C6 zinc cluster transcription factor-like protein [Saxophila tyrrhenica]
MLEKIYVVRHGYRSNWTVDPTTGTYTSSVRTPTGIPSDPALASYGVRQSEQLATHLATLTPAPDYIVSSPYYRCLQTIDPYVTHLATSNPSVSVTLEPGIGEFYGRAPFTHPHPAGLQELKKHFSQLRAEASPIIIPAHHGETIPQLHDRVAYCLHHLITRADQDPDGPKAMLLCTHAAAVIAIGRALTGRMPEEVGEEDFGCFTCGLSTFACRGESKGEGVVGKWDAEKEDEVPDVEWRGGKGVGGGWKCVGNSDCSFLEGGEERGWNFHMENERIARLQAEADAEALAGDISIMAVTPKKAAVVDTKASPGTEAIDEAKATSNGTA